VVVVHFDCEKDALVHFLCDTDYIVVIVARPYSCSSSLMKSCSSVGVVVYYDGMVRLLKRCHRHSCS
jgi:hypothetical protein